MPTLRSNGIDLYYETAGQGEPLGWVLAITCAPCLLPTPRTSGGGLGAG